MLDITRTTKPELSVEEFNALYAEVTKQAHKDLEIVKSVKNGESYNTKVEIDYWNRKQAVSDDLQGLDMEDMIEAINEFKEECKQYEDNIGYYVQQKTELSGDYEDEYANLEAFFFEATWSEPIEEVTQEMIDGEFRDLVRFWLAPLGTERYDVSYVDCKLLTLFKEGKIDWNTLRTLVYSDCNL